MVFKRQWYEFTKIKKYFFSTPMFFILVGFTSSGTVYVQWNKNKEIDLAGYKVYWGSKSRRYTKVKNAGLDTMVTINHLRSGDHSFVVSAYDSIGNESDYSEEVTIAIEHGEDYAAEIFETQSYNFPNPFDPEKEITSLRYFLSAEQFVSIDIYDTSENLIRNILPPTLKSGGEHTEDIWDGKSNSGYYVANGIYYCVIGYELERKVITIAVVR